MPLQVCDIDRQAWDISTIDDDLLPSMMVRYLDCTDEDGNADNRSLRYWERWGCGYTTLKVKRRIIPDPRSFVMTARF